jgi:hypothetical protein
MKGMDDEVAAVVLRLLEVRKLLQGWGGSRSGTRPQDREVACGVSGYRVVIIREGTYGGRGLKS